MHLKSIKSEPYSDLYQHIEPMEQRFISKCCQKPRERIRNKSKSFKSNQYFSKGSEAWLEAEGQRFAGEVAVRRKIRSVWSKLLMSLEIRRNSYRCLSIPRCLSPIEKSKAFFFVKSFSGACPCHLGKATQAGVWLCVPGEILLRQVASYCTKPISSRDVWPKLTLFNKLTSSNAC